MKQWKSEIFKIFEIPNNWKLIDKINLKIPKKLLIDNIINSKIPSGFYAILRHIISFYLSLTVSLTEGRNKNVCQSNVEVQTFFKIK